MQNTTLEQLTQSMQKYKAIYSEDGVNIIGIFGSFAKEKQTPTSDIDIAYTLDKKIFFEKYQGFASVSKLAKIQNELAHELGRRIDFISLENSNKALSEAIKKEMIYV